MQEKGLDARKRKKLETIENGKRKLSHWIRCKKKIIALLIAPLPAGR